MNLGLRIYGTLDKLIGTVINQTQHVEYPTSGTQLVAIDVCERKHPCINISA